jgi:site-specific recombinase XerD
MARKTRPLPIWLNKQEIDRLCAVVSNPRDLFMIRCMYFLGLRIAETVGLAAEDFDLKCMTVKVRRVNAKRNRERVVPIPAQFLPFCKVYLSMVGSTCDLFGISTTRGWQIVTEAGALAKLGKKCSPHVLRHSYATAVYQQTHDLALVQELLGHADIKTTRIYAHCDLPTLERGVGKVSF